MTDQDSAELLRVDCECAADCGEDVLVTIAEYAAAHAKADYVLVRPGHPVNAGSRGSRVVAETPRHAVIAEGWSLTDDELSAEGRARLAELRATSLFRVACECVRCEAGSLADAAQVEVTLDEWDRFRGKRLVRVGHPSDDGSVLEQNDRFVVVGR